MTKSKKIKKKLDSNPKISVIVPVYNVGEHLKACLDSLLSQTFSDFEVIAVNDGSTDSSAVILAEYANKDSRVKVLHQENKGLSSARNAGLKYQTGDYVCFLDGDDYLAPVALEKTYKKFSIDTDIVVYGYQKVDAVGMRISGASFGHETLSNDAAFRSILSHKISPMACNKLYRSSLFRHYDILFPVGLLHEDLDTIYRLFWHAREVRFIAAELYYWTVRDGSITSSVTKKHVDDVTQIFLARVDFLNENCSLSAFKEEYALSLVKMFNLLLERSSVFVETDDRLVSYISLLFDKVLDSSGEFRELVKEIDLPVYKKFNKLFQLNAKVFEVKANSNGKLLEEYRSELTAIHNSQTYKVALKLRLIIQRLLPLGSKRRKFVEKFFN
jgi:glycosyltransferase involved in cell wall biosynthesis